MQAVAFYPEELKFQIIEKSLPSPSSGEVLVRTLRVGIDGSDRRISTGEIGGETPPGDDHLVLGHEAVGVVEDANGTDLDPGTFVAPLVRRPTENSRSETNRELDMAMPGKFCECGIFNAHGYLSEYFVSDAKFLVPIPGSLVEYGFLIEPISIVEKSLDRMFTTQSTFNWCPESALIIGNGNLGLLALARLAMGDQFDRIYCLGRRSRPDPTISFIESLDGTYIDSRQTAIKSIPDEYESVDYVFEATGYPNHGVDAVHALTPNGVAALQGIPSGSNQSTIDYNQFHREMVVNNKTLLGIINARQTHFEAAIKWLSDTSESIFNDLITNEYGIDKVKDAFTTNDDQLKSVIIFE